MPVATPDAYLEMLDRAKYQKFAYPAINISSSATRDILMDLYAHYLRFLQRE